MRTVLLISAYFPPMGVSGAKRPLHLVRHLPARGWQPVVLAAPPVTEAQDASLLECVPAGTPVDYGFCGWLRPRLAALRRARPPRPPAARAGGRDWSFLTPFDRYFFDIPAGLRAARRLVAAHRPAAIHVSADPWSSLILARRLARETGLPLVVDLRDPWSQHAGKMALRPAPSRWWLRRFEARLMGQAAAVVLNTEAARRAYVDAYAGRIPQARFHAVRNAFDEGLFRPGAPEPLSAFTVLYFGRFRRFVGPEALLDGFARFVRAEGLGPDAARLRFVGGLDGEHMAALRAAGLQDHVDVVAAVPFRDSLPVLRAADVLCLVIEPDCHLQIPGKLYDYLAARRPILAISANAEADGILAAADAGLSAPHGDAAAVAQALAALRRRGPATGDIEPWSAARQADAFAALYASVAGPTGAQGPR